MKAEITRDGRLIVSAKDSLEGFALDCWFEKNHVESKGVYSSNNLIIKSVPEISEEGDNK